MRRTPDPSLTFVWLTQLRLCIRDPSQQGDRDIMPSGFLAGEQVITEADNHRCLDLQAGLLGHFANGTGFKTLAMLQMTTRNRPIGRMASFAFTEQYVALRVDEYHAYANAWWRLFVIHDG